MREWGVLDDQDRFVSSLDVSSYRGYAKARGGGPDGAPTASALLPRTALMQSKLWSFLTMPASLVLLSGMGADVADPKAAPKTLAAFGDTETQTASALGKIALAMKGLGLGMGHVVQMHVYLAADPKLGRIDFAGMMRAYVK